MRLPVLALIALFALPALAQDEDSALDLLVSADWLARELGAHDLVVLHLAGHVEDYEAGHLPGAVFIPLSEIMEDRDGVLNVMRDVEHLQAAFSRAGVGEATRVVVYGDRDGLSAARGFMTLDVLGHRAVAVLDGGRQDWKDRGYPLSTNGSSPEPAPFVASLREGRFAAAEELAQRLSDPELLLLDARPPAEYLGSDPGTGIQRPGHIPGAINLFWQDSLNEFGRFRPLDDVETAWRSAGLTDEVELVTYCRTGMQASHAYFTARLLGFNPRIYDPSFHEWSNLTEFPVAHGER